MIFGNMKIITAIFLVLYILIDNESNKVQAETPITVSNTASALLTPCAQTKLNGGYTYNMNEMSISKALMESCSTIVKSVSFLVHSKKGYKKRVCKKSKKKPGKQKLKSDCFGTYRTCREKCRWVDACMEECRQKYYKCIDSNWDTGFLEEDIKQEMEW
ncbi:uncharacterized protein LOC142977171 [Anticarsia gemmatalis]|uniref:uncharacterized protein LOC142977171 n=1 Tax=Anticarsia gemmatalis TaxID=129554 RepID=UPI003F76E1ED